jgi:site-specific DNA recombinase
MIAAVYARKSTEQNGVADEQKSVARQVEHARQYAKQRGWTVDDGYVFVDVGISGAEFANRPGFLRLMNALRPRPPFQVLVMSEESRLGREAIETAYALKQLVTAGVRVFFYLEDRERTLDSPTDKIMLSLTAFADELEREKARQRTYDAMQRKARAGHVTGGRVFGYDNIDVVGPDGKRSHVERRVNGEEAAIVRRIFQLCADGAGYPRIARTLNDAQAPAPRPQCGRPAGWAPSSVREILKRPLYRGEIVWNRTRKRDRWGQHRAKGRSATEWIRLPAPNLRIVSDELWHAAHDRLQTVRERYLTATSGRVYGRPRDVDSKYLLPGFARCARCNGGLHVRSRSHGQRRAYFYACTSFFNKGKSVCQNGLEIRMERADRAVLEAIGGQVLAPDIIADVVAGVWEALTSKPSGGELAALERELTAVSTECARIVQAIASGWGSAGAGRSITGPSGAPDQPRKNDRTASGLQDCRGGPPASRGGRAGAVDTVA